MTSFVDNQGDRWTLEMTFRAFRRLHAAGFDVGDITELERLATDPDVAMLVLMELCEAQMTQRQLTQEQFEDRFDLDVLGAALQAVTEAIIDFFPQQRRAVLRRLLKTVTEQTTQQVDERLQIVLGLMESGKLDARIKELLNEQLGSVPA